MPQGARDRLDHLTAWGTVGAALAAALAAAAAAWQGYITKVSSQTQLSAYANITGLKFLEWKKDQNTIYVSSYVKNFGQTPAYRVEQIWETVRTAYDEPVELAKWRKKDFIRATMQNTLSPGQEMNFIDAVIFKEGEFDKFISGKEVVMMVGYIEYDDIFSERHSEPICYKIDNRYFDANNNGKLDVSPDRCVLNGQLK